MNMTFGRCSQKRFGKETGLILDLAAYLIVDEENVGQYYPDFAFSAPALHRENDDLQRFQDKQTP